MMEKEKEYKNLIHMHGCGKNEAEKLKTAHPELFAKKGNVVFSEYIENVPLHFAACDLAITRSGALTLAEITEAQIPAVLIPSENVVADHQYKNALKYKAGGAAILIRESATSAKEAANIITDLMENSQALKEMKNAAQELKGVNSEELFIKAYTNAIPSISAKH
jgi:UDP-N-acetylglucosamine--N-acetylmuramyl-(pentapeptide) pyrophosphoryl-undecaprenol N-acetylglucosamine transferase